MESTLFLASSTFPDSQVSQWVSRHESTLCSVGLQLPGEQDQGRLKVFLDRVQRVNVVKYMGRSPQSCTVTDFEMETSNFVLFLLISIVSAHFWAMYNETIHCQAWKTFLSILFTVFCVFDVST